jgi:CHAT domain-containing protein/tetratricopeptide (TPR) repeat protein
MTRIVCILYQEMGDLDKAESNCREALKLARASGDRWFEAGTLFSLGSVMKDRSRFREATSSLNQALKLADVVHATDLRAEILNSLGDAYLRSGDADEAAKHLNAAVELAQSLRYRGVEAEATERLGRVESLRGHYAESVRMLARASSLYREHGDVLDKLKDVEYFWARAEQSLGHREEALSHYRETIALLERLERFTVPSEMARAFPMAGNRAIFEDSAALLVEMNRPDEALDVAESGRARAFLDVLNESKIDLRSTLTAGEREREDELTRKLSGLRDDPGALANALAELEAFYLNLRRSNPAYAQLRRPELATSARIRSELISGGTVFLEYMLGDKQSLAWAVGANGIRFAILPGRSRIQALATAWRGDLTPGVTALTAAALRAREERQSRKLYDILIAPFADSIGPAKHLLIAPDGALAYLPFEALLSPRDGKRLIERCSISYSQSASATLELRAMRRNSPAPKKTLLAFGDANYGSAGGSGSRGVSWTSLPNAHSEILGISRLYGGGQRVSYLGADATDAQVKRQDLRDYRYLHFAVHSFVDEDNPARSGLVLAPDKTSSTDGLLRMEEIALLRTNADLVTLSACRTGIGRLLQGEGLMALSRAFFYAGAHTVIATLWDVNDLSTARLMQNLYAQLNTGLGPEDALREAKLRMLRGNRNLWRDPHFWAPFVVLQ